MSKRDLLGSTAPITIMDAITDPDIFGPWFHDRESFAAWFAFLKCLFGLPLDDAELEIFRRCTGRDAPVGLGYLLATLIVGRRGGKSLIMALIAAFLGCFVDWSPYLTGGEKASIVIVAADRKQAAVIFRYLREMLAIPLLSGMIERETLDTVELSNGVLIEIQTASWRSIRGRTVVVALCDEAAFWQSDDSANPDVEIINALKPAMATIPAARMLIASSPYARRGVLWNDYEKHYGENGSGTLIWKADTRTMNPSVPQAFVDAAYADDPASAGAEYGAEFRTDAEVIFDRDTLRAVTIADRHELPAAAHIKYFGFCDPSGGSSDSMTIAVGHTEAETAILDAVRERRPPFSPDDVTREFCALLKNYGVRKVRGDRYSGQWVVEAFDKYGVVYEHSERTASELYLEFLPLLNAHRVELLDHKRGLAQLAALERRTSRTGRDLISHPPSAHDDVANVIAAVLVNASIEADHYYHDDEEPITNEANFRLAQAAFMRGALSGRDLYWFKLEKHRRTSRVAPMTAPDRPTPAQDFERLGR